MNARVTKDLDLSIPDIALVAISGSDPILGLLDRLQAAAERDMGDSFPVFMLATTIDAAHHRLAEFWNTLVFGERN